jgi:hypothetical protein
MGDIADCRCGTPAFLAASNTHKRRKPTPIVTEKALPAGGSTLGHFAIPILQRRSVLPGRKRLGAGQALRNGPVKVGVNLTPIGVEDRVPAPSQTLTPISENTRDAGRADVLLTQAKKER